MTNLSGRVRVKFFNKHIHYILCLFVWSPQVPAAAADASEVVRLRQTIKSCVCRCRSRLRRRNEQQPAVMLPPPLPPPLPLPPAATKRTD
ncbi:hypothetical protein ISN44_As12g035440 [Arabidopsis suecica]|uniref:Secreted protein n=1 Tax=Arabidopsis suecica TaxID=45249 RepID=A0A8T1YQU4_ARASU|nr:hypothetical protein ISN44_As12g035440 [Arabidopsis suecica]